MEPKRSAPQLKVITQNNPKIITPLLIYYYFTSPPKKSPFKKTY